MFCLTIALSSSSLKAQVVAQYGALYSDATFAGKAVNVTLPVGNVSGAASSSGGNATYSIPISVPPGTNGIVPTLSVSYNSMAGDGQMGMGWAISSGSMITRIGNSPFYDASAVPTSGSTPTIGYNLTRPVEFSSLDKYAIDGQRLIIKSGNYGYQTSSYGTEVENFSTIYAKGTNTASLDIPWFEVVTKEGIIMEYGNATNSKKMAANGITTIYWLLNRIKYPDGNYIDYKYITYANLPLLDEIVYTGNLTTGLLPYNKVKFTYALREDYNQTWVVGNQMEARLLINKITMTTEGAATKEYVFNYAKSVRCVQSQLIEVTEKGADGTSLNSTIFKYNEPSSELFQGTSNLYGNTSSVWYPADVTGDGKKDIVQVTLNGSSATGLNVLTSSLNGGTPYFTTVQSIALSNILTVGNKRIFADYDGDGLEDIMFPMPGPAASNTLFAVRIYHKIMAGQAPVQVPSPNPNYVLPNKRENAFLVGDFNGDGRSDIILVLRASVNNTDPTYAYILTGGSTAWVQIQGVTSVGSYNDWALADQLIVLDFNGDGKDDVLKLKNGVSDIYTLDAIYPNNDFDGVKLFTSTFPLGNSLVFPGDFNGDGKTDLLTRSSDTDNTSPWQINLSTGVGFVTQPFTWPALGWPNLNQMGEGDKVVIADFDQNGKSDIFFSKPNSLSGPSFSYSLIYYSKGNGLFNSGPVQALSQIIGPQSNAIMAGDFSGEGSLDIMNMLYSSSQQMRHIRFNGNCNEFTLQRVKDGYGNITEWSYKRLSDATAPYSSSAVTNYPINTLRIPVQVVTEMKTPNSAGGVNSTTFQYQDFQIHKTKGGLGFRKETQNDHAFNLRITSTSEVSATHAIPYLKRTETFLISTGNKQKETVNTQQFTTVGLTANPRVYQTLTSVSSSNLFENRTSTSTNTWDNFGNVLSSTTNHSNVETTTTTNIYVAYVTGIPNRLTETTASSSRLGNAAFTKKTTFGYNPIGQLVTQTDFVDKAKAVTTTSGYNTLGNRNSVSIAATGLTTRTTTTIYDPKGRFAVSVKDPLLQEATATFDARWGKALTTTSIDGLTTTYLHDAFGREKEITPPTGVTAKSTIDYAWDLATQTGNGWGGQTYKVTQNLAGKPDVVTFYNSFGQVKKVQQQDFVAGQWLTNTTTHNARGSVITSTAPYKSTETPFVTTTNYSDYPIRVSSVVNSFGSTQYNYSYAANGNLTTSVTDPAGFITSSVSDPTGKTLTTTDAGGTLSYLYHSNGQVSQVSLGASVLQQNMYDDYGRQTRLSEVNAGITNYEYDAFGQLVYQFTANGHTTTNTYDILGRITLRAGAEGNTTTTYHTTGVGKIGKVKNVTGFSGDLTEYNYDTFGRLLEEKITFDGLVNATTYAYNVFGDVTTTNYPGLSITHNYNAVGYLTSIQNGTTTLFTPTSKNGLGQYTGFTLGSGMASTITYNQGIPTRYLTAGVQDLNFTWNFQNGNLTSRNDALKVKTENFTYSTDGLNRLLTSSGIGLQTITTSYAANGNIATKSDAGTYLYQTSKLNAVTAIQNSQNIPTTYQDITYTQFLQPQQITEGANTLVYTYGANQQRLRMVLNNGAKKRYYFNGYEVNVTGATTMNVYYIPLGGNTMAMFVKVNAAAPTLFYAYSDYLGSILAVTTKTGGVTAEQNFDAWGRQRNHLNWSYTATGAGIYSYLYRGYTGHEHVYEFGLINMNGRMYDPVVGRMLSVDNYTSSSSQGFNRYSYAMNNPLKYTDPSGEFVFAAAFTAAVLITSFKAIRGDFDNKPEKFVLSFAISFAAGAVGSGVTGGVAASMMAGGGGFASGFAATTATNTTGFFIGAASNGAGGFVSGWLSGTGGGLMEGRSDLLGHSFKTALIGGVSAGIKAGLKDGIYSSRTGRNFWTGDAIIHDGGSPAYASASGDRVNHVPEKFSSGVHNAHDSRSAIFFKPDDGRYGLNGGMHNKLEPGQFTNVQADGVATPMGYANNSVFRIPAKYGMTNSISVRANGSVFTTSWKANGQNAYDFFSSTNTYGWVTRNTMITNNWMVDNDSGGFGWHTLWEQSDAYYGPLFDSGFYQIRN
jgi:RHS repeat-associated protein